MDRCQPGDQEEVRAVGVTPRVGIPREVTIDQLPKAVALHDREYTLEYKAIEDEHDRDELRGMLLVVSDVTEQRARERRDALQREMLTAFQHLMRDRAGFVEFAARQGN